MGRRVRSSVPARLSCTFETSVTSVIYSKKQFFFIREWGSVPVEGSEHSEDWKTGLLLRHVN